MDRNSHSSFPTVCYAPIKGDFWHGYYGSFDVVLNKKTGFINVSKLCREGRRLFSRWKNTKFGSYMLSAFTAKYTDGPVEVCVEPSGNSDDRKIAGTYLYYKIVPFLASWLNPDFAVMVGDIITGYLALESRQRENALLERIEVLESHRSDASKEQQCVILFTGQENVDGPFHFYIARRQMKRMKSLIRCLCRKNPTWIVFLELDDCPINLYSKIKETIPIKHKYNHFSTCLSPDGLKVRVHEIIASSCVPPSVAPALILPSVVIAPQSQPVDMTVAVDTLKRKRVDDS